VLAKSGDVLEDNSELCRGTDNRGAACCAPIRSRKKRRKLFDGFRDDGELEFGFGQGLDDDGFGAFRGSIAGSGHFADEEILGAFEHFLFAEGKRFTAAEGHQTLENYSDLEEGAGTHALRILLEAVFPVRMTIELSLFEEAEDFAGFGGADNGAKANRDCVGLWDHDTQTAGNNADHVISFGSSIQNAIIDLFNNANAVVRINDLVADLVVHG